jgi:hypothetical protein
MMGPRLLSSSFERQARNIAPRSAKPIIQPTTSSPSKFERYDGEPIRAVETERAKPRETDKSSKVKNNDFHFRLIKRGPDDFLSPSRKVAEVCAINNPGAINFIYPESFLNERLCAGRRRTGGGARARG